MRFVGREEELSILEKEGILHHPLKQVDSSKTQNSKDNKIPLPPKVI